MKILNIILLVAFLLASFITNAARPDTTIYPNSVVSNLGGGWYYVYDLGSVNASSADDNWMYHNTLEWIYVQDGGSVSGAWYYDQYADDWFYGYNVSSGFLVNYNGQSLNYRLLNSVQHGGIFLHQELVNLGVWPESVLFLYSYYYDHDFTLVHTEATRYP